MHLMFQQHSLQALIEGCNFCAIYCWLSKKIGKTNFQDARFVDSVVRFESPRATPLTQSSAHPHTHTLSIEEICVRCTEDSRVYSAQIVLALYDFNGIQIYFSSVFDPLRAMEPRAS